MVKRQADRLKEVITELINTVAKKDSIEEYTGDIAEDFPREWNKILRVTELHPDSKKSSRVDVFKNKTFLPLENVKELSDDIIGSVVIVEAAGEDKELLSLKVTAYDDTKQIITGELDSGYEMGFRYMSIRGYKA